MRFFLAALCCSVLFACVPAAVAAQITHEPTTISTTFARVKDSVALIEVEGRVAQPGAIGQTATIGGLGSGVLISADGLVLTAAHVVQTADKIQVRFAESVAVDAEVVRSDPAADVALIKLAFVPDLAKPVPMADSDLVGVGDQVFVVGAPLGLSYSLTVGHLSARRRPNAIVAGLSSAELFQTDAAINQGNSGGPLFNVRGEVIGIVSHIISMSGGFDGLGFAVTTNAAKELLMGPSGFWTGMAGFRLSGRFADIFNVPQSDAILVEQVAKGSPAERLGLRGGDTEVHIGDEILVVGGDIILEVSGLRVGSRDNYRRIRDKLSSIPPGDTLVVKVLRAGEILELSAPMPARSK